MPRRDAALEGHESPNEAEPRRPRGCLRRLLAFCIVVPPVVIAGAWLWQALGLPVPVEAPYTPLDVANRSGHPVRIELLYFDEKRFSETTVTLETDRGQVATKWMTATYATPTRRRFPVTIVYTELDTGLVRRGTFTADRRPARYCHFGLTLTPEGPRLTACHPQSDPYNSDG